jgi:hypothetical protein
MITLQQFLRDAFRNQHGMIDRAVKELTPEQVHWLPPETKLNHIGNTLWHYVRTEDNIVQFILQGRKPTVWVEGGFHEKWGLDKVAQGTGMTTDDAHAMRLPPMPEWMEYQSKVWEATDDYLATVEDEAFEREHKIIPFGEIPASRALSMVCLTHGHAHFGEICAMRVLQGLESTLN